MIASQIDMLGGKNRDSRQQCPDELRSAVTDCGAVDLGQYGNFTYSTLDSYVGFDEFYYAINLPGDPSQSNPTRVTIRVGENSAPFAISDSVQFPAGQSVNVQGFSVLFNDFDAEHDVLTAVLDTSFNSTCVDLVLRPNGTFALPAQPDCSFAYRANDSLATSALAATVEIHFFAVSTPTSTPTEGG
jgi:Bacterial cadherin-like domain